MEIRQVGAELFHADSRQTDGQRKGQTDRQDEANSRFSQICELAKRREVCVCVCVRARALASRCFEAGNMQIYDTDYRITHQVAVCIPGC